MVAQSNANQGKAMPVEEKQINSKRSNRNQSNVVFCLCETIFKYNKKQWKASQSKSTQTKQKQHKAKQSSVLPCLARRNLGLFQAIYKSYTKQCKARQVKASQSKTTQAEATHSKAIYGAALLRYKKFVSVGGYL